MAVTIEPGDYWPNYALASNAMKFNTSTSGSPTTDEVTDTLANATTGDARQVLYALVNRAYRSYIALDPADRPSMMTLSRSTGENGSGQLTRTFVLSFVMNDSAQDIVDE